MSTGCEVEEEVGEGSLDSLLGAKFSALYENPVLRIYRSSCDILEEVPQIENQESGGHCYF